MQSALESNNYTYTVYPKMNQLHSFPFSVRKARKVFPSIPVLCKIKSRNVPAVGIFKQKITTKKSQSPPIRAKFFLTEKSIFPIPFKLNGIWSWWLFAFQFWTKWNSIWLKIERKTVTTIISHSIWKEMEY